jgi:hypothetical protein
VQNVSKKLTARIVGLKCLKWKEKFFLLVPGRDNKFDCPCCKIIQLWNFEVLHHRNAHHVRYLCAKS